MLGAVEKFGAESEEAKAAETQGPKQGVIDVSEKEWSITLPSTKTLTGFVRASRSIRCPAAGTC